MIGAADEAGGTHGEAVGNEVRIDIVEGFGRLHHGDLLAGGAHREPVDQRHVRMLVTRHVRPDRRGRGAGATVSEPATPTTVATVADMTRRRRIMRPRIGLLVSVYTSFVTSVTHSWPHARNGQVRQGF